MLRIKNNTFKAILKVARVSNVACIELLQETFKVTDLITVSCSDESFDTQNMPPQSIIGNKIYYQSIGEDVSEKEVTLSKVGILKTWLYNQILPEEVYEIPEVNKILWANDSDFIKDLASGDVILNDGNLDILDVNSAIDFIKNNIPTQVTSTGEIVLTWTQLKGYYSTVSSACQMNFIDLGSYYYIWLTFRDQKFYIPKLVKNTSEALEFETSYKSKCNIPESPRIRITTNRSGRRLHDRYITFKTSSWEQSGEEAWDNTDWKDQDYQDVIYTMKDVSGNTTLIDSECKETWIQIEPKHDFEISGGSVFVPEVLGDGTKDDEFEIHVIGVPTIPQNLGGEIHFVSNPRIKWLKSKWLLLDASLNPAEMKYNATYHTNRVLFLIKHPVGSKTEFQINLKLFK